MSHEHERLWNAVNQALDARRDPLEDPGVQEELAADPDQLDELARVLGRIELVAMVPKPHVRRRRVAALVIASVLVAAIILTIVVLLRTGTRPTPNAPQVARATDTRSRILRYKLEVVREGAGSKSSITVEPGRFRQSCTALIGATIIVSTREGQLP